MGDRGIGLVTQRSDIYFASGENLVGAYGKVSANQNGPYLTTLGFFKNECGYNDSNLEMVRPGGRIWVSVLLICGIVVVAGFMSYYCLKNRGKFRKEVDGEVDKTQRLEQSSVRDDNSGVIEKGVAQLEREAKNETTKLPALRKSIQPAAQRPSKLERQRFSQISRNPNKPIVEEVPMPTEEEQQSARQGGEKEGGNNPFGGMETSPEKEIHQLDKIDEYTEDADNRI